MTPKDGSKDVFVHFLQSKVMISALLMKIRKLSFSVRAGTKRSISSQRCGA
ncbi:hypothetical protein [Salmonella enterica]|uniref:hypothetical protein n=1 Tax=Salmonella enterica TaxID=28901 RepID=UPI003D3012CE